MDIWKKIVGQHWPFYSHQRLYDMVKTEAAGPGAVSEADQTWREFSVLLAESRDNIERLLKEAGASWEGLASETMQARVTPLAQWADDAHTAGSASSGSVQQIGDAFSYTANAMPEPVKVTSTANSDWGGIPAAFTHLFGGQTDQDHQMQQAQQAKQRAVELMQGYSRNSESAVSGVGTFVAPQPVTVNVPPPQLGGGSVNYQSGSITGLSGGDRSRPESDPRREQGVPGTESSVGGPGPVTDAPAPSAIDTPIVPPGPSTETTPESVAPLTPTPGVVPDSPLTGGLGSRLPDSGFGPVTAFPVDPRTGHPVGGGPGAGGGRGPIGSPGSGESERISGSRGGPGARPSAGTGGMMGPLSAGAPSEEDEEHRTPEYLREHHDDWYDLPPTAPPALGDEDTPPPDDENGSEGTS